MIGRLTPVALFVVLTACDGASHSASERASATAAARAGTRDSTEIAPGTGMPQWDDSLGAVVATPSIESGAPLLFVRDTAQQLNLDVELFTHDAQSLRAVIHPQQSAPSCLRRRAGQFVAAAGQSPSPAWSLALGAGVAIPLAAEGVGDISVRDSAARSVVVRKLVNALPDDAESLPFHGLPVVVRDAWRVILPDKTTALIAIATRTINEESNPRAQTVTLVAESDAGNADTWKVGYFHRNSGPEDRVEGADFLAAILLHGSRPVLAFVREGDTAAHVDLIERTAAGVWRLRWSTDALGCAG
jgi:hypothetical protein